MLANLIHRNGLAHPLLGEVCQNLDRILRVTDDQATGKRRDPVPAFGTVLEDVCVRPAKQVKGIGRNRLPAIP